MTFATTYTAEILPATQKALGLKNVNAVPQLEKIVVSVGIGSHVTWGNKDYSAIVDDLTLITGQKPTLRKSKKAISNFKLREDMPVGLQVTLRWEKMHHFLEKLMHVVLPRVRDFQGLKTKSFDQKGNYNIWLRDHTIFPEIVQDDIVKPFGLQITVKTSSETKESGHALLREVGLPFVK